MTAFIVTPIIGNHLNLIGVKFAYCAGMFFGEFRVASYARFLFDLTICIGWSIVEIR